MTERQKITLDNFIYEWEKFCKTFDSCIECPLHEVIDCTALEEALYSERED